MEIKYLNQTSSTNEYIKENIGEFENLDAVYTMCQTNGKGRMGRTWSADGGIAFSFFVKAAKNPMLIPLCAAIAVYNALEKSGIKELGIKWPNDILACGKKLCGILCEGVAGGYIVGVGINNKQSQDFFNKNDLPYATSVEILGYDPLSEEKTVEICLDEFNRIIETEESNIIKLFSYKCINIGKIVRIIKNNQELIGKAIEISAEGGLVVEFDGMRETVISGEVSVRGIYGYSE